MFKFFLGCCGYGSEGNSVNNEMDASSVNNYLNYQIPRRDCVIIPGLYTTIGTRMVQFSDICGNAGLGGGGSVGINSGSITALNGDAFTGNWRTGVFIGTTKTTYEKTLCSKLKSINL